MISKKLFTGGINSDDADILVDPKEYLNALNIRFATTESGKVGQLSNVEGNTLKATTVNSVGTQVAWTLPDGTNTTIGAIEDTPNKRIFFFNKNVPTSGNPKHGIYCYDADTSLVYNVLLSDQVEGGLEFSEDIHSIAIIDNLLYWTDGVNPQRRINVDAGIKSNHSTYVTIVVPYTSLVIGSFTVGANYTNGTATYVLTGGSGSGAEASITVANNIVTFVRIVNPGRGYLVGDVLTASIPGGAGFSLTNAGISQSVISLARNKPWIPLAIEKKDNAGYANNFIKNEAFEFAYRFLYRDYEYSTFSPLSELANYNTLNETTKKYIEVIIPSGQKIDQDVIKIEIAVRFVVGGAYSVVKTFDNKTDFEIHNSGATSPLKFDFYNDAVGLAVSNDQSFKPFEAIPLKSETLEIARNRLFLANNTDGYEAPKTTSLDKAIVEGGGATYYALWTVINYITFLDQPGDSLILYIGNIGAASGYYYAGVYNEMQNPPSTVDFTIMTKVGDTIQDIQASGEIPIKEFINAVTIPGAVTVQNAPASPSIANDTAYKSDSSYGLGVVFYDDLGRNSGVVTRDDLKVVTPDRTYSAVSYYTGISWTLSNVSAESEIPAWAKYYSIVMTKNLRTSFFLQSRVTTLKWVTKNTNGEYVIQNSYDPTHFGLAVDISALVGIGYGYKYQEGDLIKIYPQTGNPVTLSVKDEFGSNIICDNSSVSGTALYEIFTPYIQNINEPYFERAQVYPVLNPGKSNRAYTAIAGQIKGDITIMQRTAGVSTYSTEAMSPSDLNWRNWNTNAGRSNIVIDARTANKRTSVSFSNVIVLGSQTNGLSTFEVLDQTQLPYELSSIQKLQLVSKIEAEGTIMLAIGEQETASMYLGESQVFDNTGSSFLAKSSGVIGNVNVLRGSYGTINPESVVRYQGNVYWFDANKGAVVSYSQNGLFPISSNKMFKYFRKVGQDILTKHLKFFGGIDPYHNEVLMYAPRKSAIPEGARLLDMEIASSSYSFTTINPTSTIVVQGSASYTFTGSAIGPNQSVVTGSTGAVTYSYSGTGATTYGPTANRPTQAGTYQVVATVASDGIYNAATSAPFPFSVQVVLLPSTIAVVGVSSYTFSSGELGPNQSVVTGSTGAVTYSYVGVSGTTYGPSTTRPTQVGSYSVTATVAKDATYDTATSAPFPFAIAEAFVFDADYMLLTYQFTDGLDLDTRTRIVVPDIGQDAQTKYVGWAVSSVWPATGTPILDWGGDNTGTGFESVLINVAQLKAQYPSATNMIADLRAFWFNTQGFNPVNVAATLWKGGAPVKQGGGGSPAYSFTNPTAQSTLNISSVGKVVTSLGLPNKSQSSGERVATLTYNLQTNTGSFSTTDTTTPSV